VARDRELGEKRFEQLSTMTEEKDIEIGLSQVATMIKKMFVERHFVFMKRKKIRDEERRTDPAGESRKE